MKNRLSIALAAMLIGSCSPIAPVEQPTNGYRAFRFRQAISVRDHALNLYNFSAGATFVADRAIPGYGTVYCGQAAINDAPQLLSVCIGLKGVDTLVLGPGAFLKEVERTLPPQTIEPVDVKL